MPKKFWLFLALILTINMTPIPTFANDCPDLKIIFARGSGEERWIDQNFLTFKKELSEKLNLTELSFEFEDLDYPAIGIANPLTLVSTFFSGGEAFEFGESVAAGVSKIIKETSGVCKNTRYVLAGYSQGAMVVSKAIDFISSEKIIYAATFGDPKIYLPEGEGFIPAACRGESLSNYRIYVPDCRVYEGLLGGYKPYQPEGYFDKLGTWCNKNDIFCSTHFSINAHTSYVKDGLYADASKLIFDKICQAFGIKNNFVSLHDTAILIDSSGSMEHFIHDFKREASSLAEKTLAAGGRVALYDYRDLADDYEPVKHCDFDSCTMENFQSGLNEIILNGGGDEEESLLSSSFKVMKKLNWKFGSTKSVVIFTDAPYHNPDLDGVTFADVVALSKKIDPVNFYIITSREYENFYQELAVATDGGVATLVNGEASRLINRIIERYDSLPRVEEEFEGTLPEISNVSLSGNVVSFNNTGTSAMVILNDVALGVTNENEITISGIEPRQKNLLRLVPLTESTRGNGVEIELGDLGKGGAEIDTPIPRAPNAGRQ